MDYPSINPNYYDHHEDLNLMVKAYKISKKISETKPLSDFIDTKIGPHRNVDKDDEIKEFIKNYSKTTYHPVGTCSMGISEKTSVVDSNLKLHGIKNLRVADASIMPKIISGNTNSACMMIGEKCADLIKESL
jgi:choline dehydrogenase